MTSMACWRRWPSAWNSVLRVCIRSLNAIRSAELLISSEMLTTATGVGAKLAAAWACNRPAPNEIAHDPARASARAATIQLRLRFMTIIPSRSGHFSCISLLNPGQTLGHGPTV
jgi:hypothetical protein